MENQRPIKFGCAIPILSVPWQKDMVVVVEEDGEWVPDDGHNHFQTCPNCRGHSSTHGSAAFFCPWCGSDLDHTKATAIYDEDTLVGVTEALK